MRSFLVFGIFECISFRNECDLRFTKAIKEYYFLTVTLNFSFCVTYFHLSVSKMQISANKVVGVTYVLRLNDANGEYVEEANDQAPMVYVHGIGAMIPAFESNIEGKQVGESYEFGIAAADAYGDSFPEAVVEIPLGSFEGFDDVLHVGNVVPMRDGEGNQMHGTILSIGEELVMVDFNHPMAGKNLYFTGKVVSIRDAAPEELDHGHVHGEGGHHH